jgi:transcriptional regulator with XRE-family HTH domain
MTASTADTKQEPIGADKKFHDASRMFSEALRRILRAADENDEGNLTSLSQTKLSEESGVGRSTLAKYLTASKEQLANPTLEVMCKLAHTLGVPPAFMFMTADDWTRLTLAINYYTTICQDRKFCDFAEQITHPHSQSSHQEIAEAGLKIGDMMGLIQRPSGSFNSPAAVAQRASVAATCLAPPITSLDPKFRPILFTLCAIIGASTPR